MGYRYSKTTGGFYLDQIQYTGLPSDLVEISDEEHQRLFEGQGQGKRITADENGYPILTDPPPPSLDRLKLMYSMAVDTYLNQTVKERFYDNIATACSYIISTNPQYKAEAEACIAWRDAVWVAYSAIEITQSTDIVAVIDSLPKLVWPTV